MKHLECIFRKVLNKYQKIYIIFSDAPSEEQVEEWLATGEVLKLEQIVLDGRGHMLREKKTVNASSNEFLSGLTQYLTKIDAIHKAVEEGDVRRVKSLIDRPLLSTARDNYGGFHFSFANFSYSPARFSSFLGNLRIYILES